MKPLHHTPALLRRYVAGGVSRMAVGSAMLLLLLASCNGNKKDSGEETDSYHADYDIAMTVRSAADALRVEEPLLAADYDFEGVLTDGEGAPLYTDVQGAPGQWQVEVISPQSLRIHNVYLGDLLPENLEQYILTSLALTDTDRLAAGTVGESDSETILSVYRIEGGVLRIETSQAEAANGVKGPLMNIILTKTAVVPEGAQFQDGTHKGE